MVDSGIRRWSFTREYEIDEEPPPADHEATVEYDPEAGTVLIDGVLLDGHSGHEGCVRRVDYDPDECALRVDVGTVRNDDELVLDIAQLIHYEVRVVFADELPARTRVRHVSDSGSEQFTTTTERA